MFNIDTMEKFRETRWGIGGNISSYLTRVRE